MKNRDDKIFYGDIIWFYSLQALSVCQHPIFGTIYDKKIRVSKKIERIGKKKKKCVSLSIHSLSVRLSTTSHLAAGSMWSLFDLMPTTHFTPLVKNVFCLRMSLFLFCTYCVFCLCVGF